MKRPKLVTVVLPAHGVEGAIASVVRDLAVAAYALRSREMELDVLLLAGGGDRTAEVATATARKLGLDLTARPAPAAGPGQARRRSPGAPEWSVSRAFPLRGPADGLGCRRRVTVPPLSDHLAEQAEFRISGCKGHGSGSIPRVAAFGGPDQPRGDGGPA